MKQRILIVCVSIMALLTASAQRTTRKGLKLAEALKQEVTIDSTAAAIKGIKVSGFDKAQSSTTEGMFISNNTARTVKKVTLKIIYLDTKGRELHQRTEGIPCIIPPGETRMINIKAWDRQHLWYYRHTQAKHNANATPFDVKVSVKSVGF